MQTSQTGIELIKQFEGCRLKAYRCAAGVLTIGYGHTAGVKSGQEITREQAERFLKEDLLKYENRVKKYDSIYHWNQNQFDALVSFAYNIGNIDGLTANGSRNTEVISQKILSYHKAAGKVLDGLVKRRKAEQLLFLKPVSQSIWASSVKVPHTQINYLPQKEYRVVAEGLRIRTKISSQPPQALPTGAVTGRVSKGENVKNHATARVGNAIWMYIGTGRNGAEQWICADTGEKAYVDELPQGEPARTG